MLEKVRDLHRQTPGRNRQRYTISRKKESFHGLNTVTVNTDVLAFTFYSFRNHGILCANAIPINCKKGRIRKPCILSWSKYGDIDFGVTFKSYI